MIAISWRGLRRHLIRCWRAFAGRSRKSSRRSSNFLELWKDADPDLPLLKQATAEYAKLQCSQWAESSHSTSFTVYGLLAQTGSFMNASQGFWVDDGQTGSCELAEDLKYLTNPAARARALRFHLSPVS